MYPFIPQSPPIANLFIEARSFTQNETESGDYLIEASSSSGGSISPSGKIFVLAGSNATFNMVPADNYKILNVLVDGESVGPVSTYTFNNANSH